MRKRPQNVQETLPGYEDFKKDKILALARQQDRILKLWQAGLSGEKLYTAKMLIICGLPLSETAQGTVVRKARLPDGSWVRVSFIRTSPIVPLPFGADRTMVYFLTNKAVLQQNPLLRWEHANEYMHLMGINPDAGKNYRSVQERFTRVAYMDIMVEYLDKDSKVVEHWKSPLIDHARIAAVADGEGNWKPSRSIAAMLAADQEISFGLRFFAELQKNPVPVPVELIMATKKSYRLMDYVLFLYWRAFAARSASFIPWRHLQEQFDNADQNVYRWPQRFREAANILLHLPEPINEIRVEVNERGITVQPLKEGTTFFEDHPKLRFAKPEVEED
jgi:hypothetical protein